VDLQQLSVELDRDEALHAEALLSLAGALAVSLGDAADAPLFEPAPGTTPLWPSVRLHALFPADVDVGAVATLVRDALNGDALVEIAAVTEAQWSAGMRQSVTALRFGRSLAVVPAEAEAPQGATTVRLNMGLAFGTGQHATTALCLEWLDAHPPRGATVYDFGCGSGVLAIAALALGARFAWASDVDPQAVTATLRNAELNRVQNSLWVGTPDVLPVIEPDIVLANILAGTLVESTRLLADMVAPGHKVVLSGILAEQKEFVAQAFAADFHDFEYAELGGWLRIVATRRGSPRDTD
jgi:ribosomal protein L11 methyltransferase